MPSMLCRPCSSADPVNDTVKVDLGKLRGPESGMENENTTMAEQERKREAAKAEAKAQAEHLQREAQRKQREEHARLQKELEE
eukprot:CAMPEP_0170605300 /NCGR_PEP_ID=MMETSP0224-20130122/19901_1 /TAXON_ID=285029 /ORGANISM="Togula jolla, Strain CCCM 725" /LENGTH=82 /DNA_ID=CAMNT_0010930297 /DNA_START=17 /DNA_END=262 /DNA_ORIENTATION=+